jgi:hypothetical protein
LQPQVQVALRPASPQTPKLAVSPKASAPIADVPAMARTALKATAPGVPPPSVATPVEDRVGSALNATAPASWANMLDDFADVLNSLADDYDRHANVLNSTAGDYKRFADQFRRCAEALRKRSLVKKVNLDE